MAKVRVVRGDNSTGYVDESKLAEAKSQGWREATEKEATAKKARREASSTTGTLLGGFEAVAAGASLGGTDLALTALGADGVGARREALGEAGTALEVAGGVAASVATGGTGAVAQGAGRAAAGVTAKQVAKRALGAVAAPTKYVTKAGTAVERAVLGGVEAADVGLGRRVAASVAGGAVEGGIEGVAGAVSESVIKHKPLTAEALVGGALAGAAFGGAMSGGATTAGGALGRVLQGAHPRSGNAVSDAAIRDVVGEHHGMDPGDIPESVVAASRTMDETTIAKWSQRQALITGADPDALTRVNIVAINEPKRFQDLVNRKAAIEESAAQTLQDGLGQVQGALSTARKLTGGEAKYKTIGTRMPKNADFVAPRITEQVRGSFEARVAAMEAENTRNFARAYDVGAVREIKALVGRALTESLPEAADGASAAERSFRAIDRLKRDSGEVIRSTGGWGAPPPGTTTDMIAANKEAKAIYADAQKHLEREDLFGEAATAQREINAAYAAVARAESEFKSGVPGSGLTKLFNPDGSVSMRQAIIIARQYGRIGGDEVVTKLDGAMQAQVDYLRTVAKHYDLGADGARQLKAAEDGVEQIRGKLRDQAKDAAFLDDLENARQAEGNRSVSMGITSTIGPSAGALIGGSIAGPVGAAAGLVAGGITRPYTTARSIASLLSMTENFGKRFDGKGMVAKLRKGFSSAKDGAAKKLAAAKVPERAGLVAKGLKLGIAFQLGKLSVEEKAKGIEKMSERLSTLSDPDELEKVLGPEFEVMSADAPETATAVHESVARLVTFLRTNLPTVHRDPFSGRPPMVNAAEADRYIRLANAALNPRSVVASLYAGTITSDEARALREVYPETFAAMSDGVKEAVMLAAERNDPIPYKGRVRLSILLGQPLETLMRPESIRKMQALYGPPSEPAPEQQQQAQPPAPRRLKTTGSANAMLAMGTGSQLTATRKQR